MQAPAPATPPGTTQARSPTGSPDDFEEELSFDYIWDSNGDFVRVSKGRRTSTSSTQTSPSSDRGHTLPEDAKEDAPPATRNSSAAPPHVFLNSPVRPTSLSRSESATVLASAPSAAEHDHQQPSRFPGPSVRSFSRVASGPASLALANGVAALSINKSAAGLPARRVPLDDDVRARGHEYQEPQQEEDDKENASGADDDVPHLDVMPSRLRGGPPIRDPSRFGVSHGLPPPAPPNGGRPLTDVVPVPQRNASRLVARNGAGRAAKGGSLGSSKQVGFGGVSEMQLDGDYNNYEGDTDPEEEAVEAPPPISRQRSYGMTGTASAASTSTAAALAASGSRPRRSASLTSDHYAAQPQQPARYTAARPGTSLGINDPRANVHSLDQDLDLAYADRHRPSRSSEEAHKRQSPPPPLRTSAEGLVAAQRLGHRRRDSDTLRSGAMPSGSPTLGEQRAPLPPRLSPNTRAAPPLRRSPTAPEVGAPSNLAIQQQQQQQRSDVEKASSRMTQREAPPPPVMPNGQQSRHIVVNRKGYARLDMIGKGGSSRVYRCLDHNNEIFAIKRVTLDKTDAETLQNYKNEIGLLKRLAGNARIIRLIDSEVKGGPNGKQGHLFLVMEYGEIDLARLLSEQQKEPMNMAWIAYYWQQMLQAVQIVHDEKIVHSDLKPANFVLVKGQLKLIDFGIANAIANDTTNIQRDHQIGTLNYMSPEAIELPEGTRRLKVGRASDVWSLGCILYQMVYGRPPFQHLSTMYHKMKAIPDASYEIEYPEYAVPSIPKDKTPPNAGEGQPPAGEGEDSQRPRTPPMPLEHLKRRVRRDVIETMKSCLMRSPKQRAVIPDLLEDEWLVMGREPGPPTPPTIGDMLGEDETVINPHYMAQLLQHGMKLGAVGEQMDEDVLLREASRLVQELKALYTSTAH